MQTDFDITDLNMEELESAKSLLKKRFPEIINGYLEDAEMYLKGIEEGLQSGDLEKAAKNAHPLKSSSAALGIAGVSVVARTIEESAKSGGTVETIKPLIVPLKEAMEYAAPKLRALLSDIV